MILTSWALPDSRALEQVQRDTRLSAVGFSLPDPARERFVPCAPWSHGAVPEGGEREDAASRATRISITHGKGFHSVQLCAKLQESTHSERLEHGLH